MNISRLACYSISAVLALPVQTSIAETDLADVPLANATTTTILPNIAFILDDSGSMDWEYMPDEISGNSGKRCYRWSGHNKLWYNPAITYLPPLKADGNRYPDADFAGALYDGFFDIGQITFDRSTTNYKKNLSSLSSAGTGTPTATLTFNISGSQKITAVNVTLLNGTTINLLGYTTGSTSSSTTTATNVRDSINNKTWSTGFSATRSSNIVTISGPSTQAGLATTPVIVRSATGGTATATAFDTNYSYSYTYYATHKTNSGSTSCDADTSYTAIGNSADIEAPNTTKGSTAAKTNYANWYSYYRKRAYLAKASAGEAFGALDQGKFRIGLFFISSSINLNKNSDLLIDVFSGNTSGTHRANWFDRLYNSKEGGNTPLREALSYAGRMYGGKIAGIDPVQYSCQKNYAILTTDGYWNNSSGYKLNGSAMTDQDGVAGVTRPSFESPAAGNTLADVAYYYYHNDLRPGTCAGPDKCSDNVPPSGTNPNVDDVATHQHMTTFTMGLGVGGTLTYQEGYKTSTSGDYYSILQGTKNWPTASAASPTAVDDLWHAAVNGRGTFFSAKNSESFRKGLVSVLSAIDATSGSGAAAATSTLEPVAGDNFIYIANYRTVNWDGELSAYTIDTTTGVISSTPLWQASAKLAEKIGTDGNSDTRTIKTWDASGTNKVKDFTWTNLSATEKTYFNNSWLSQYATDWSADNKTNATSEMLVNYLRGQDRNEDQVRDTATYGSYYRLYRDREKFLGDIVHSQPAYVKKPKYDFLDNGYAAYKAAKSTRAGTVYVASNDGILHAFDATTGAENWAYIPPIQLKNIWHLADKSYPSAHRYLLDGPVYITDVNAGTSASPNWKTILVGAMGKGGRGIYAMDVTDPAVPIALWNYTADDNANLGYTYDAPLVTKLADGTWVVLLASGYNNIPEGGSYTSATGKGYVFVLNALTGTLIKTIDTGVGSVATPAGLAYINTKVLNFSEDNTAKQAYAGDNLGNLWRIDLDAGTSSKVLALGSNQPITVYPEIAEVSGKTVLFFGTGRYLGEDDLSTTNTQSFYAVRDDGSTTVDPSTQMEKLTLANTSSREITGNAANWDSQYGWYMDLPTSGERVNIAAQLFLGTVIFASIIPSSSECQPGGYSYLYYIDYKTGMKVPGSSSNAAAFNSPVVGFTATQLPSGDMKLYPITADGSRPNPTSIPKGGLGSGGENGRRVMWRELLQ